MSADPVLQKTDVAAPTGVGVRHEKLRAAISERPDASREEDAEIVSPVLVGDGAQLNAGGAPTLWGSSPKLQMIQISTRGGLSQHNGAIRVFKGNAPVPPHREAGPNADANVWITRKISGKRTSV